MGDIFKLQWSSLDFSKYVEIPWKTRDSKKIIIFQLGQLLGRTKDWHFPLNFDAPIFLLHFFHKLCEKKHINRPLLCSFKANLNWFFVWPNTKSLIQVMILSGKNKTCKQACSSYQKIDSSKKHSLKHDLIWPLALKYTKKEKNKPLYILEKHQFCFHQIFLSRSFVFLCLFALQKIWKNKKNKRHEKFLQVRSE